MTFRTVPNLAVQHGERIVRIGRDAETGEYRCRLSAYGTDKPEADYFTDDLDDAKATARSMANPALAALRHHVSGAIARGEGVAIVEQPTPAALEHNLDAAQRELDRRNAEGEDVSHLRVNPQTAAIEEAPVVVRTIDMTPTWGEIGNVVKRLAMSRETKALNVMWSEVARAMAAAQALQAITKTLNDEQSAIVSKTLVAELTKQGY